MLEDAMLVSGKLIITGDFNFQVDNSSHVDSRKFLSLLDSFGLDQHIQTSTHSSGHILDLLITKAHEMPVSNITVEDPLLSDHHSICFNLDVSKPKLPRKEITFRKIKAINSDQFKEDLTEAINSYDVSGGSVSEAVDKYNSTVQAILDKHAPLQTNVVTVRSQPIWYCEEIHKARKEKRKAERKWRTTGLTIHKDIYKEKRNKVTHLISQSKKEHYRSKIGDAAGDQKVLFRCVNELLYRSKSSALPSATSNEALANDMSDFFVNKVQQIRQSLESLQTTGKCLPDDARSPILLSVIEPTTEAEVRKLIMSSPSSSCPLDPLPTPLLKQSLDVLLPSITAIINRSLSEAEVPDSFKMAIIIPLLKKETLDEDIFKNYRPISNLAFLSKILERVVSKRLEKHSENHPNTESMQSAYKHGHSTETALVKIHHDILQAIDNQNCVLLVLLDLSAAFDTVDHEILIHRLQNRFGITGKALDWLSSYLSCRTQQVMVNGTASKSHTLTCNVPQGSVLGPKLFVDYESPVGDIVRKHGLDVHFYADDTQIYFAFKPEDRAIAVDRMEKCIEEVREWMAQNFLKLNDDKTELITLGSRHNLSQLDQTEITIGNCTVEPSTQVRNIGATFDSELKMEAQVAKVCKSAWHHMYQIGKIRPFLTQEDTRNVVHAFITSKLDLNNCLLAGIPDSLIAKLQRVQNASVKLIFRAGKFEHVSGMMKELHWLPIPKRIDFKILLLAFKALHCAGPSYLRDLLQWHQPQRQLRSSNEKLLVVPKSKLKRYGDRSFGVVAPKLWNSLPFHLRNVTELDGFKQGLKTHLFKLHYGV